jgi:hypothetical protein
MLVHESTAVLRIFGDTLVPDGISRVLGAQPTHSHVKGEVRIGSTDGRQYTRKTGAWLLHAADRSPADLDGQITEILGQLTDDLQRWASLAGEFHLDLFCGLFMKSTNDRLDISAKTLMALGSRGIGFAFDIYDPGPDARANPGP